MSNAALRRLSKAVETAKTTAENAKKQAVDSRAAEVSHSTAKRRKVAESSAESKRHGLFSGRHDVKKPVDVQIINVSQDGKLMPPAGPAGGPAVSSGDGPAKLELHEPMVFRFASQILAQDIFKGEIDSMRSAFSNSAERTSHGRGFRPLAATLVALAVCGWHDRPRASNRARTHTCIKHIYTHSYTYIYIYIYICNHS